MEEQKEKNHQPEINHQIKNKNLIHTQEVEEEEEEVVEAADGEVVVVVVVVEVEVAEADITLVDEVVEIIGITITKRKQSVSVVVNQIIQKQSVMLNLIAKVINSKTNHLLNHQRNKIKRKIPTNLNHPNTIQYKNQIMMMLTYWMIM